MATWPQPQHFHARKWHLFSKKSVFDLKQSKSDIPRLYAIFQLKLCLSTKMKPLILGAKITMSMKFQTSSILCNETLSFGSRFRIWNLKKRTRKRGAQWAWVCVILFCVSLSMTFCLGGYYKLSVLHHVCHSLYSPPNTWWRQRVREGGNTSQLCYYY